MVGVRVCVVCAYVLCVCGLGGRVCAHVACKPGPRSQARGSVAKAEVGVRGAEVPELLFSFATGAPHELPKVHSLPPGAGQGRAGPQDGKWIRLDSKYFCVSDLGGLGASALAPPRRAANPPRSFFTPVVAPHSPNVV